MTFRDQEEGGSRTVSVALVLSIVALVSHAVTMDLPWWDEAAYHRIGQGLLEGGDWRDAWSWSPLYGVVGAGVHALVGLRVGPRLDMLLWTLFLLWMSWTVARGLGADRGRSRLVVVLVATSAFAYIPVGVHRAGAALVLLGVHLARRVPSPFLALVLSAGAILLASLCRLDCVLALPVVLWVAWKRRGPRAALSRGVGLGVLLLALAMLGVARPSMESRNWMAFSQHYALFYPEALPERHHGWMDYQPLLAQEFPGAGRVSEAWRVAPSKVLGFRAKALFHSLKMSIHAVSPRQMGRLWWFSWIWLGALLFFWKKARPQEHGRAEPSGPGPRELAVVCLALALTSASGFLVYSNPRHLTGVGLAILLGACLHPLSVRGASRRLLGWVALGGSLASVTYAAKAHVEGQRPYASFVDALQEEFKETPVVVTGSGAPYLCYYMGDACQGIPVEPGDRDLQARVDLCAWFEEGADLVMVHTRHDRRQEECVEEDYRIRDGGEAVDLRLWERIP